MEFWRNNFNLIASLTEFALSLTLDTVRHLWAGADQKGVVTRRSQFRAGVTER